MSDTETAEPIHIYLPAVGRMTRRGYGVALTDPVRSEGVICWFRDRDAFLAAQAQAVEERTREDGRNELSFAVRRESFRNLSAAVRALVRIDRRSR